MTKLILPRNATFIGQLKKTNIIHCICNLNEKNHAFTSIKAEKVFVKFNIYS